jgi:hypothetical protein
MIYVVLKTLAFLPIYFGVKKLIHKTRLPEKYPEFQKRLCLPERKG